MTREGFGEAYKLHRKHLHILATRLVGYQNAEDVLQDAVCRLLDKHLEKMPDDYAAAKPYFITALFSVGLDYLRHLSRERNVLVTHSDVAEEDVRPEELLPDTRPGPAEHAESLAFLRAFRGVRMTTREWQAVIEFYVKGRSTKDIAQEWGVKGQYVLNVRSQALCKLREGLKEWKCP